MGSFTIHSLDEELDRRLSEEARRRKTSKNRLVFDTHFDLIDGLLRVSIADE